MLLHQLGDGFRSRCDRHTDSLTGSLAKKDSSKFDRRPFPLAGKP